MCGRQIDDVDVVSDGASVWRREIRPEHVEYLFAKSRPDREGNCVSFRLVPFEQFPCGVAPCSIEIAQDDGRQAVTMVIIANELLADKFRTAVRVDGNLLV